jgi:hypothetical protein
MNRALKGAAAPLTTAETVVDPAVVAIEL